MKKYLIITIFITLNNIAYSYWEGDKVLKEGGYHTSYRLFFIPDHKYFMYVKYNSQNVLVSALMEWNGTTWIDIKEYDIFMRRQLFIKFKDKYYVIYTKMDQWYEFYAREFYENGDVSNKELKISDMSNQILCMQHCTGEFPQECSECGVYRYDDRSIVADDNNIHIVFTYGYYFKGLGYIKWDGVNTVEPQYIRDNLNAIIHLPSLPTIPSIAIDSKQTLHLIYTGFGTENPVAYPDIIYLTKSKNSDLWSDFQTLVDTGIDAYSRAMIMVDQYDNKIVAGFYLGTFCYPYLIFGDKKGQWKKMLKMEYYTNQTSPNGTLDFDIQLKMDSENKLNVFCNENTLNGEDHKYDAGMLRIRVDYQNEGELLDETNVMTIHTSDRRQPCGGLPLYFCKGTSIDMFCVELDETKEIAYAIYRYYPYITQTYPGSDLIPGNYSYWNNNSLLMTDVPSNSKINVSVFSFLLILFSLFILKVVKNKYKKS